MVDTDLIQKLLTLMDQGGLTELLFEQGDCKIKLSRRQESGPPVLVSGGAPVAAPAVAPTATAVPVATAAAEEEAGVEFFRSPMVGTFYRRPNPDADPFCNAGDRINEDSVMCIIEAMKVFNEIKAEMTGEIVEVLVQDGDTVQFDQPLFKIRTR